MAAGERFTITGFSTVTSGIVAQNDVLPPREWLMGLSIQAKATGNYEATISFDNGVGITDVTSMFTSGGATITNQNGYWAKPVTPWKVWINVTSIQSTKVVSFAVGIA